MIQLNAAQQKAAYSLAERRLVIAGPGSGKSRCLIAAVACAATLRGAAGCVVLTYTNASAAELLKRLADEKITGIGFCGTLHSFLLRQLTEQHGGMLSVIDDDQRLELIRSCMEDMGVDVALTHVLATLEQPILNTKPSKVELVGLEYHMRLKSSGLVDFNTILHEGTAAVYKLHEAGRWPYHSLFADESQDAAQPDWCFYGSAPFKFKFLVGDPDQSIYSFRGGNPEMMVTVAGKASNFEVHMLEENYRCAPCICEAAQRLIEHNSNRLVKMTESVVVSSDLDSVEAHRCDNPQQELRNVSCAISWCMGELNIDAKEIAVLARTNAIAKAFAEHLQSGGCPVSTIEVAPRPEDWIEAKLLLTVLANPWNDVAVAQLIAITEGPTEAKRLREAAALRMKCINEVLDFRYGKGDASIDVDLSRHGISVASRERIHDAARELGHTGKWSLNELIVYLGQQDNVASKVGDGVTCCTIHSAKGREFSVVFVVGCEENLLPSAKDAKVPELLEESRRLLFVAMTRAKRRLSLTWCAIRPENRGINLPPGPLQARQPSRFLREMGIEL